MAYVYKYFSVLLLLNIVLVNSAFAQESVADTTASVNIYVNKKTNKSSFYSCSNIKLPTNYIKGSISASTTGPVLYVPNDKDKTAQNGLQGQVMADLPKAPSPGLDARGRLYIEYEVPANDPQNITLVKKMRMKVKFMVYSIKVYMKDTMPVCGGKRISIPCLASPPGGNYEWSVMGDIILLGKSNVRVPQIITSGKGSGTATMKYTIGGISYSARTLILNVEKPLIITADTITVFSGNIFTIKPRFLPEAGDCEWVVKDPLLLYGDNLNYGSAKIYAGSPGITTVSVLYKSCTELSRKNIVVIVKSSRDVAAKIYNNGSRGGPVAPQNRGYFSYFGYGNYYYAGSSQAEDAPGPFVSYKNSSKLCFSKPNLIENNIIVPDSMVLVSGEKQEVRPFIAPEGGKFSWEATNGINVLWASLKATAYIEGMQEGTGFATVTYNNGSKIITKKIKVIVKGEK